MQIPNEGPRAAKDTTQVAATRVRYRVLATTFVNGRLEHPERADGAPNYVSAAPGLAGPALELAPDEAPKAEASGAAKAHK